MGAEMKNQWQNISKLYSDGILTSDKILYPAILNQIKNVKNKKILDVGCGVGHLSYKLQFKGAVVTGIDSSRKMIEIAKQLYSGIDFYQLSVEELFKLNSYDFDYVVAVMLFLCLDNRNSFEKAFNEIVKKLKVGGKLILIDLHPCAKKSFNTKIFSQQFPENSYFDSGKPIKAILENKEGEKVKFIDFNWTLQDFSESFKRVNLSVSHIREIRPTAEIVNMFPELEFFSRNPTYLLIELTKQR